MCPLVPEFLMFRNLKEAKGDPTQIATSILDPATTMIAQAGKMLGRGIDGGNGAFSQFHKLVTPAAGQAVLANQGEKGEAVAKRGVIDAALTAAAFTGGAALGLGGTGVAGAGAGAAGSGAGAGAGAGAASSSISPLAKVAIGLQLAGGAAGAVGSYQQGVQEAKELKRQAKLEETRANLAFESAAQEKRDLQRRQRQAIGKARTMAAANGVLLDNNAASSPNVYTQDALAELQYESDKIDYNTELEAYTRRENARVMRKSARTARRSGMLKSATSLITSGAAAAGTYYGARA